MSAGQHDSNLDEENGEKKEKQLWKAIGIHKKPLLTENVLMMFNLLEIS